jgi:hypothetical protein
MAAVPNLVIAPIVLSDLSVRSVNLAVSVHHATMQTVSHESQ